MRPPDGELLRLLADMPFLDRLEAVAVSGWSRGAVYGAVRRLEDEGLAAPVPHATDLTAPTRRFHLTAAGLRRLAQDEGVPVDGLLRTRPVSTQWRRLLLERLDAVAVVYRLASAVANVRHPIRFRWYRAMPMDAAIALPGGRTVAVVRQGHTADRSSFAKRLWRLKEGPRFGGVLLVVPDETRLRYARRLLTGAQATAVLAIERDAAAGATGDRVWRLPSVNAAVSLREAIDRMDPRGAFPAERPLARASMPDDIGEHGSGRGVPDHMLPALLKPAEKRTLDLLSDWPWLALDDLAGLLGLVRTRTYEIAAALQGFGLVTRVPAGGRRLTLTDQGLAMLARRDRAAVGGARKRWSAAPRDAGDWRSVSGRRSRQLLRNMEHTGAVHGFMAALARQARELGLGDRPARPATPRLPPLPALRRDALRPPRRLRHPAPGEPRLALLPRVGAPGRAPGDDGGAAGPLPALLLVAPPHRRPRRSARRPGRLRRRLGGHPLPARGATGDGPAQGGRPPAGLPPGPSGAAGAAGTGLARPGRLRAGQRASGDMNPLPKTGDRRP